MWKTNLWSPRGKERRGINWEIGTNIHTLCWERLRAGGESGKRRWLDSIIDSTHMSLRKLRETVKDRKAGMLQSTQLQRIRATEQLNNNSNTIIYKIDSLLGPTV